jgi:MarR family transcriptional regulator, organic hydroperoxide resistance regulator
MGLREELKQVRPFRSQQHEAALALLRTADMVRRTIGRAVEPQGLSFEQFNVLRILRGAGADGLATLEVAERLVEATPAITRLLDKLESKGLVERERSSEDRRRIVCRVTKAGLKLLAENDDAVEAAHKEAFTGLNREQVRSLVELLGTMREK